MSVPGENGCGAIHIIYGREAPDGLNALANIFMTENLLAGNVLGGCVANDQLGAR